MSRTRSGKRSIQSVIRCLIFFKGSWQSGSDIGDPFRLSKLYDVVKSSRDFKLQV